MSLHDTTYAYLAPSDAQVQAMARLRAAAKAYSDVLERELPEGPDKTFALRNHRTTAMWTMVAVSRQPDGSPREAQS
jgi:methylmalonyl-CoA mutase N-terminal domain/subunit